jgi:hypothetical protein
MMRSGRIGQHTKMKFKTYVKGTDLTGSWLLSYKIDGVQVWIVGGVAFSKVMKKLAVVNKWLEINHLADGVYEYYTGSWNESISHVKNMARVDEIKKKNFYLLSPAVDSRLIIGYAYNPMAADIQHQFDTARSLGYEGLVLYNPLTEVYLKDKDLDTLDVKVLGWKYGTGRNAKRIGAIVTDKGNVTAGLTDRLREELMDVNFLGSIIEVSCMEMIKDGKMRHPRFIRCRPDKDE